MKFSVNASDILLATGVARSLNRPSESATHNSLESSFGSEVMEATSVTSSNQRLPVAIAASIALPTDSGTGLELAPAICLAWVSTSDQFKPSVVSPGTIAEVSLERSCCRAAGSTGRPAALAICSGSSGSPARKRRSNASKSSGFCSSTKSSLAGYSIRLLAQNGNRLGALVLLSGCSPRA